MSGEEFTLLGRVLASDGACAGLTREQIAEATRQAASLQGRLAEAMRVVTAPSTPRPTPERLLSVEDAAIRLGVTKRWLYRNAKRLPFTRKLTRRTLRFHEAGLERYIREKKP